MYSLGILGMLLIERHIVQPFLSSSVFLLYIQWHVVCVPSLSSIVMLNKFYCLHFFHVLLCPPVPPYCLYLTQFIPYHLYVYLVSSYFYVSTYIIILSIFPPVNIYSSHINPYFHVFHMSTCPSISAICPPVLPYLPNVHLSFYRTNMSFQIFHMFTFTFIFAHYFTYTSKCPSFDIICMSTCPSLWSVYWPILSYLPNVHLSFISSICPPVLPYFPYVHLFFHISICPPVLLYYPYVSLHIFQMSTCPCILPICLSIPPYLQYIHMSL